ncbi:ribonuclease catalytic domain-containing protein [Treponema parvum]|uniref:ribonuclease catalytic domain-containing protein n=1 Tax=Treponema parvum TaxID=138851 RepID=UPI001AEC6978|nr:RNB domain-containing ribonuclease [Treponema parvum]QTQ16495.1 RNB domain-containing ribonuclease [Treponema parvum]
MIQKKSLVLYKKQPAVVTEVDGDKYTIEFRAVSAAGISAAASSAAGAKTPQFSVQKVREKDIIFLIDGVSSIQSVLSFEDKNILKQIKEVYELIISDEEEASKAVSFSELKELVSSAFPADGAWFLYDALLNSFEFKLDEEEMKHGKLQFFPQTEDSIKSMQKKMEEKEKSAAVREEFLSRLKQKKLILPDDAKFMVDVEALALGKSDKSKTLQDAGIKQTQENAHKILLDTGIWEITRNPYPVRWGLSMQSATESLPSPPKEERIAVEGFAYAIDSEYSNDPDDAVGWDGTYLWVHIADPASTVIPDSSIDKTARARGATLYIPEGASRMLCESVLSDYALGLNDVSYALSFRIKFDEKGAVEDCAVLKTAVRVKRLSFAKADEMKESKELHPLFEIAKQNEERRKKAGAVLITLPEVHISVDKDTKKVEITKDERYESEDVVREAMLLAGEGAAKFAFKNNIPFPYVSQDKPEIPKDLPQGLAGQFKLRRCMRKRNVGVTPSPHSGLGISMYSQVTSPLRRYGDLVAHEQLHAFLDKKELLTKDVMLERISAGDAAAAACKNAERNSNLHWTLVYLLQNPDWKGEAVCVEQKGNQGVFIIPSLAQETLLTPLSPVALNGSITVQAAKIDIVNLTVTYRQVK